MTRKDELIILLEKLKQKVLLTAESFIACAPTHSYNIFHLNHLERAIEDYKGLKEEYDKLNIDSGQKPEHGD